jgi:rhamnulokinase
MVTHYLAIDLGAESGRVMLGSLAAGRLEIEEIHRFPNQPIRTEGSLHWDVGQLFAGIKAGLSKAAARHLPLASISCDAWGVDYVLVDPDGELILPAFHYRDPRTARGVEAVFSKVSWATVFAETGIQFMPFNALYQLATEPPERLARARFVLPVGDAFNYLLSGVAKAEVSAASTMQVYNPETKDWSKRLLTTMGFPGGAFPEIVASGTRLGQLRPELVEETGLAPLEVLATCSHDTGAAVAAVPAETSPTAPRWAYLSSGTWSLLGVELPAPIVTDLCRELNFTNEIGYGGTVRLLKNITGLWIVQECRRAWAERGAEYDYGTLMELAGAAPAFESLIDPADPRFLSPGGMPEKIAAFCRETGQAVPANPGATIRCVLESLALLYRRTLRQVEQLAGGKIERLHVVGGGSRNALLNQCTANALQLPVIAGPVEATAIGNLLLQAIVLGHLPSLKAARAVVKTSFGLTEFQPAAALEWAGAARRFERLAQGGAGIDPLT